MFTRPPRRSRRTCLAVCTTWNPTTQIECTLYRRRLPVSAQTPTALIAAARQLLPDRQPTCIEVFLFPDQPKFALDFGSDPTGTRTTVYVMLHAGIDLLALVARLFSEADSLSGLLIGTLRPPDDEDGESIVVPTMTEALMSVGG